MTIKEGSDAKLNVERIYYITVIMLPLIGVMCIRKYLGASTISMPIRYRRDVAYRLGNLKDALYDKNVDPVFARLGVKISKRRYDAIRKLIILMMGCLSVIKILEGELINGIRILLITSLCYAASAPNLTYRGRKTPFFRVTNRLERRRAAKLDEELTSIIIQMKNIIISKENGMSGNYILTRLLPFTDLSQDAFSSSLAYVRQGEMEKAGECFAKRFGTKLGDSFAHIILKLDKLPPKEFLQQLTNVQGTALQQHKTRAEEKFVKVQTVKRILSFGEAILIMGNFVYLILIDSLQTMNF